MQDSVQSNAVQSALRHQRLSSELEGHSRLVALLEVLAGVHEDFLAFDEDLESGRYCDAAERLSGLQAQVARLPRVRSSSLHLALART